LIEFYYKGIKENKSIAMHLLVEQTNENIRAKMGISKNKIMAKTITKLKKFYFEPLEKGDIFNTPIHIDHGRTSYAKNEIQLFNMPFFEKSDYSRF